MKNEPFTILLAEDNPDHAELAMRSLKRHPIVNRVMHTSDGEATLDYLYHRGKYTSPGEAPRPDLLLLDLRLPRVDGLEVLRTVKEDPELRPIPVVIVTSSDAEKDVARAYNAYVNSYLVKPLSFEKLTALIQDLGEYWMEWNQKPN